MLAELLKLFRTVQTVSALIISVCGIIAMILRKASSSINESDRPCINRRNHSNVTSLTYWIFYQREGIPRSDTPSSIFEVLRWLVPLNWLYRLYIFILLSPLVNPSSSRLPNGHLNGLCSSSLSKTGFFVRVSPHGIPFSLILP